jgi:uncharacterized coiled-coil protein SlyX
MRVLPLSRARDYACSDVNRCGADMFAKRSKQSSRLKPPTDDDSQTEQSGSEDRGSAVERLERELDEQRNAAKTLRESLDAVTFQKEILEKSYAKQLGELREKLASLEAEVKEKDEILANLDGGQEQTLRELNDALTVIKVLKKERDKLRKQHAQGGSGSSRPRSGTTKARALLGDDAAGLPPAPGDDTRRSTMNFPDDDTRGGTMDVSDDGSGDGTINALIATGWADKKKAGVGSGQATAQVDAPQEQKHEEMLSPDLVFSEKDKE